MRALPFLVLGFLLTTCSTPPSLLEQIRSDGVLEAVTRASPTTYYEGVSGPTGPEYDLVKGFADHLGVELEMRPVESFSDILPAVRSGEAHLAAAGLSVTESREKLVSFSRPYDQVTQHLVYRLGTGRPQGPEDIIGKRIRVVADTSHADTLRALAEEYPELEWEEDDTAAVADLLDAVANDELDYTVADSTTFAVNQYFHPDLRVAFDLEVKDPVAWAFRKGRDHSLPEEANRYLTKVKRDGTLAEIMERYYGHTDQFDYVGTRAFIRHYRSRLPRYRELFEEAGEKHGVDWRLLAAIGYQESHWRPSAVSPTGVRGIMMLTRATADYLGIENRVDPKASIMGGARFFSRLKDRLPDDIEEPDRTWLALAAYNVGYWHVKDARTLTEWKDGDPTKWMDVSQSLPLLAQKKWYSRLDHGYARGWEPVLYVENIRSYLDILRWLTAEEETQESESVEDGEAGETESTDRSEAPLET